MLNLPSPTAAPAELISDPKIATCLKSLYHRRALLERLIQSLERYAQAEVLPIPAAVVPASRETVAH